MRVAVVTGSVSPLGGGFYTSVRRQAQQVAALKVEVGVFALNDSQTSAALSVWDPLTPRVFSKARPAALGRSPALGRAVREFRPDVVHSHGVWLYLSAHAAAAGRPVLVSPRGMLDQWALRTGRAKKWVAWWLYERAALRRAGAIHCLNQAEAEAVGRLLPRVRRVVIPNGIDPPTPDDQAVAETIPPPWGDVGGRRVMLFMSRLHPKKGLPRLLTAWHARRSELADWVLAVAGWDEGGHLAEVESQASALGLNDSVRLVGPLHGSAKAAALAQMTAAVLPSYSEGLPMTALEAWAWGKPVVLTDACNLPEGFAAVAAWRLPDPPAEFAAALAGFVALPDVELRQMGVAGAKLVRKRFTWPAVGQATLAVYNWLAGGTSPPAGVVVYP